MTTQTPATAEIEKWLWIRVQFFTNFWLQLRIQVRRKNSESCQSRLRYFGSMATSEPRQCVLYRDDHGAGVPEWTRAGVWILGRSQYFRFEQGQEPESTSNSDQKPFKIFKGPTKNFLIMLVVKRNRINWDVFSGSSYITKVLHWEGVPSISPLVMVSEITANGKCSSLGNW